MPAKCSVGLPVAQRQGHDKEVTGSPAPCLTQEGVIGTGRIWAFYSGSCHIPSALRVSPGMIVSLISNLQQEHGSN